jgi:hypothetical protein
MLGRKPDIHNKFDLSEFTPESNVAEHISIPKPTGIEVIDEPDSDYASFELSEGDADVAITPKELGTKKNMPTEKVLVDTAYLSSPQHHGDKVIVDAEYQRAVKEEFIELPSELLEEIHENPQSPEQKLATVYDRQVESLVTEHDAKIVSLEVKYRLIQESLAGKKELTNADRQQVALARKEISKAETLKEQEIQKAEREFQQKMFEQAEPYEVDPEKIAAASKKYMKACESIEDDYEGDMAEDEAEFKTLYSKIIDNSLSKDHPHMVRLGQLERRIKIILPAQREKRLRAAELAYREEVTPTEFERNLYDATVLFEKKSERVVRHISEVKGALEQFKKFPDVVSSYSKLLEALRREEQVIAAEYSAQVALLKKEHEEKQDA